ncbi:MAG: TatD family hydrolase [Bacilli bacterium]
MFVDTHCHVLSEYYDNIDEVVNQCKKNNVNRIIVNGCDINSNKEVLELVSKYDIIYGAIGFHPTELDDFKDEYFEFLENNISNSKIVAIGEIGLDYYYDNTDKDKQKEIFKRQLDIANKYSKPIIVHSRNSIQDTYNILKKYNLSGSIHCFSGSIEMAREFIKIGYKLGIGGIITYKNAKNIKEVVKAIDLSYILLETDSPYLTPSPYRGKNNSPEYIPLIASTIADIKNISINDVSEVTTANAEEIFDFFSK